MHKRNGFPISFDLTCTIGEGKKHIDITYVYFLLDSMGNRQRGQPITERDIEILVQLTKKKENEIRQWYEEFHRSTDGNNLMSKRQFEQFYCRLKKKENLKNLTEHIFRAFDTDRSSKNCELKNYQR